MEADYGVQKTLLTGIISYDNRRVKGSHRRSVRNLLIHPFAESLYREFNSFFFKSIVDPVLNQGGQRFPPVLRQQHALLQN